MSFNDQVIALEHVRLIDGTGAPARANQTIVVDHGVIVRLGEAAVTQIPEGARTLDSHNFSVYPGLIGMHEHMFYPTPGGRPIYSTQILSAPILYLASRITTMRTAGTMEPYSDMNIKGLIDKGVTPGPDIDVSGPYIQGPGGFSLQMPVLRTPEDAQRFVDYWATAGVTSFKAYMNISHDALQAAIQAAHQHGTKITGHLCSV